MKFFQNLFFIAAVIIPCISCSKNKKGCWQGFTPFSNVQGLLVCDKTKAEAEAAFPQYWFYNASESKYCWKVETQQSPTFYIRYGPRSMVDKWRFYYGGYSFTKTDCNSFCIWNVVHEKHKSKVTGLYGPTYLKSETFTTDTCSKLYTGRIIVIRETTDSIITREFVEKIP
jgi:hypothetical protein